MWKRRRPNRQKAFAVNRWYDIYEDWGLIEASFASQYGIRLRSEPDMSWAEFCTLLAGIMPETPLGQVISIRSEEDKDVLKNFTPEQHRIRNEWRSRQAEIIYENMTEEEKRQAVQKVQEMFAKAFS